jgi:hypothetical protein
VEAVRPDKFHGRIEGADRSCDAPGCGEAGEFRAPGERGSSFDGPGDWRWLCLDHVREFNSRYDWFAGMSGEEILAAQHPLAGWEREVRAFAGACIDQPPRWADFADPLEAIAARAKMRRPVARADGRVLSTEERRAFEVMGLAHDVGRVTLRRRYAELVRKYHPDRNGGDRSFEARLGQVVEAYQLLRLTF